MKRSFFLLLVLFQLFYSLSFGQTLKQYNRATQEAFNKGDYYTALKYGLKALQFEGDSLDRLWIAAESARRFNSYSKAEELYTTIVTLDKKDQYTSAKFYKASMQEFQGKYSEAKKSYEMYLVENKGDDAYLTAKAEKGLASIDWINLNSNSVPEGTRVNRLGDDINSVYTDFAPVKIDDKLYYSSNRFATPKDSSSCSPPLFGNMIAVKNGVQDESLKSINVPFKHTANTAINVKKNRMYYTICENIDSNKIRCDLYYRDYNNSGYSIAKKLPDHINLSGYTNTQPSIGRDKISGKQILYWVSDRPGGKGKLDIWYSHLINDSTFSEAINLKEINTAEDDITPFIHSSTGELYFSSDGRLGYGGFDIYKVIPQNNSWSEAENLGTPINSSYNDIYFTLDNEGKKGLLSSNRKGSLYLDELQEACCNDIYDISIQPPHIKLNVKALDKKTMMLLPDTKVKIINKTDPSQKTDDYVTNENGEVLLDIARNTEYNIISNKTGYYEDTVFFSTYGVNKSQTIEKKIFLDRAVVMLHAFTFDKSTQKALPQTKVKLIDLTDNSIDSSFNNTANDFHFVIKKGHSYQTTAEKDGYNKVIEEINTTNISEDNIRKDLYLEPKTLPELIPIALYFDNDQPDIRSNEKSTKKTYSETFSNYYRRKEEFKRKWDSGINSDSQSEYNAKYDSFFEDTVKGNYEKFTFFLDQLINRLQEGTKYELVLKGYASPRAESPYNKHLSDRRISSVENGILKYRNGILKSFNKSQQLVFIHEPYGEEKSNPGVSDDLFNQRLSIYSIEASRERKVEIINIILKN